MLTVKMRLQKIILQAQMSDSRHQILVKTKPYKDIFCSDSDQSDALQLASLQDFSFYNKRSTFFKEFSATIGSPDTDKSLALQSYPY